MEPIIRNWEIAGRDPKTGKFILKQVGVNLLEERYLPIAKVDWNKKRGDTHTEIVEKIGYNKNEMPAAQPQKQPKKKLSDIGYRSEITFGNDLNQEQKKFATDTPKKSETNKTYKRVLVDYVEESENGSQTIRLKKPPLLLKYNGKHKFVGAKTIAIEFSFFINANPDKENEITDNSILF